MLGQIASKIATMQDEAMKREEENNAELERQNNQAAARESKLSKASKGSSQLAIAHIELGLSLQTNKK